MPVRYVDAGRDVSGAREDALGTIAGIYAEHVFSRAMDFALRGATHRDLRRRALAGARGHVLEIGFGTGLNLACYPAAVRRVTGVDPASALPSRTGRRIAAAPFPVERVSADAADRLPFPDAHFDSAATTWTLCSIARLREALLEVRRALKPGADLHFLEHGLSDRPRTARVQELINPVQNVIAAGCNINRRIDREVEAAGLEIVRLERFSLPGAPRALGSVYMGRARPRPDPAEPPGPAPS